MSLFDTYFVFRLIVLIHYDCQKCPCGKTRPDFKGRVPREILNVSLTRAPGIFTDIVEEKGEEWEVLLIGRTPLLMQRHHDHLSGAAMGGAGGLDPLLEFGGGHEVGDGGHKNPQAMGLYRLLQHPLELWSHDKTMSTPPHPRQRSSCAIRQFRLDLLFFFLFFPFSLFWQIGTLWGQLLKIQFLKGSVTYKFLSLCSQPSKYLENSLFCKVGLIFSCKIFLNPSFPWQTL